MSRAVAVAYVLGIGWVLGRAQLLGPVFLAAAGAYDLGSCWGLWSWQWPGRMISAAADAYVLSRCWTPCAVLCMWLILFAAAVSQADRG